MAAFQFPDPADQQTVVNPITGSTYQWKEPPGKWVVTVSVRQVEDIIWEGDNPPDPIGDYKLWYSTDTLELYFHYCDVNGVCAWLPTSVPITMLEDLDNTVFDLGVLLNQVNQAASTNENEIQTIKDGLGQVDLQEVLDNGNTADKGAEFGGAVIIKAEETAGDGDPLFAIEGDQANAGSGDNLFVARHHSAQGDQVRYYGPVVNSKEITTKEYVDSSTDLEGVLNNGNVADKGFVLTNLENDAILVSPEDARIMVGGIGEDVVPRLELRHETGLLDTSIVKLELDEDGERFDIECDEKVDNIHFRFNDDVKFEINKTGDAVFSGKIKVQPGTEENEAATFGQLATVAEEIEQLAPSYERGTYSYLGREVTSSNNGRYSLRRKNNSQDSNADRTRCNDANDLCKRIPDKDPIDCDIELQACLSLIPAPGTVDVYVSKFSEVEEISFNKIDANGENHTWDSVKVGQLIDVFNDNDDGFMVAQILEINGTSSVKTFAVSVLSSKGIASGTARVKVFNLNETGDTTNYVRKTGDSMTGKLEAESNIWIRPRGDDGKLKGANGANNMLVVNQHQAEGGSIARFQKDELDILKIEYDRNINCMDNRIIRVAEPEQNTDAVNKKWVTDNTVAAGSGASQLKIYASNGVYYIEGA